MKESKIKKPKGTAQNSAEVFSDYAHYYDLLYRDKNYDSETEYLVGLIHKFHPSTQSILEMGSGTGIHASLLARKGFNVHGIERSAEMLSRSLHLAKTFAQEETPPQLSFSKGDIRSVRLHDQFDAVIALFHVISYQTTNEDVLAAFKTARYHLKPDGIFVFDVWYGPAVLTEHPEVKIKRVANDEMEITRLAEPVIQPNENRVDVNYHIFVRDRATDTVKELKETHSMRYFFNPGIDLFAVLSGFNVINAEEWLSAKPIDQTTWSACFCLQAK